ncbi:MAG: zinc-ribbon domain containing protein [Chloroflexota bacterium]|jgi:CxxC-x17-CxxC domain-containing protein
MTDKTLTCRDCGASFVFTEGEQEFFASRGFTNEPSRCPECRAARKRSQGGFSGGSGRREMFATICSQCGKETQVPFQPRGDKPVYCSECFESVRGSYSSRSNRNRW